MKIPTFLFLTVATWLGMCASAPTAKCADPATVTIIPNLAYKDGVALNPYESEHCRLDLYVPAGAKDVPCLLWFHGGALVEGSKSDPGTAATCRALASEGILVASAEYRFSPTVKYPAYLQDAAAAVAWTHRHATEHGGNPSRLFISGHSAGGYLTAMLALDDHLLSAVGINRADLSGFIPISGPMTTPDAVCEERGLPKGAVTADDAAPIKHVHADTPPWLILYADGDTPARITENRAMVEALVKSGNHHVTASEIAGRNHMTIMEWIAHPDDPARARIVAFIRHLAK